VPATDLPPTSDDTPTPLWVRPDRARTIGGDGRLVLGAAASLSRALGVDPVVMRLCFIVLTISGGWGILLYLAVWLWFLLGSPRGDDAPVRPDDPTHDLGVALVTLGLVFQARMWGVGFVDELVWPAIVVSIGLAVAWRRVGDVEATGWLEEESKVVALGPLSMSSRLLRLVIGAVIVLFGTIPLVASDLTLAAWIRTVGGVAIVLTGVVVMFAPMLRSLATELVEERRRRIRADERDVISSHLHDSVLQTLALIQKRSGDPAEVANLARRQERELRDWLHGEQDRATGTLKALVSSTAAEVEDLYLVPVECVTVGDVALDEQLVGVVAAAREAMVNAAKFSEAASIDVYTEVGEEAVEIFVRDRGKGFDPGAVAPDRRGISESIVRRLERVGGTADIRSSPGEGAEVRLRVPREVPS